MVTIDIHPVADMEESENNRPLEMTRGLEHQIPIIQPISLVTYLIQ
jgi:hypothetical protein